jgi:NAD(P)-dependent dehydrogenase (short-subunit alcohol dehydrogenase family)
MFSIKDKVIVVTGAFGQLGCQYSLALLKANAKVAMLDLNYNKKHITAELQEYIDAGAAYPVTANVTDKQSLKSALNEIESNLGDCCGLINNAALDAPPNSDARENGPFEDYPLNSFENVMQVNVGGVMQACQVFGARMAEHGVGSIINIASIYGLVSPDQRIYNHLKKDDNHFYKPVSYSVSKSAIYNLTRYLATYWAKKGVRVNTLTLGGVFNNQDETFIDNYSSRVPMDRMAQEDEYNGAIIFLMSRASSYMTGSNMVIDGGWTAW